MSRGRLEAFSDGVIAVLITILVLEFKVPHGVDAAALKPMLPVFLSYVLSFAFLGIYWSNHHHMLHMADRINGKILWANLHLLFWLSLTPFVTTWMGENYIGIQGPGSKLKAAVQSDWKGRISILCYLVAIPVAFVEQRISIALYVAVALMWLVPDRRIESRLAS